MKYMNFRAERRKGGEVKREDLDKMETFSFIKSHQDLAENEQKADVGKASGRSLKLQISSWE